MKFICVISFFFFLSCNKKENITLNVLNDTLVTYPLNSQKDTVNIIKYSLENDSDKALYINNGFATNLEQSLILNDNLLQLNIINDNEIVKYFTKVTDFVKPFNYDDSITAVNQRIEYNYIKKSPNVRTGFILHPKEKIFLLDM